MTDYGQMREQAHENAFEANGKKPPTNAAERAKAAHPVCNNLPG